MLISIGFGNVSICVCVVYQADKLYDEFISPS
jgi:hypothetical protein